MLSIPLSDIPLPSAPQQAFDSVSSPANTEEQMRVLAALAALLVGAAPAAHTAATPPHTPGLPARLPLRKREVDFDKLAPDVAGSCSPTSWMCYMGHTTGKNVVRYVQDLVVSAAALPDDAVYPNDRHIACRQLGSGPGGFCLFFQGVARPGNRTGRDVRRLMEPLHAVSSAGLGNCAGRCGVVWDKRWGGGRLKLDYVHDSCVDICKR